MIGRVLDAGLLHEDVNTILGRGMRNFCQQRISHRRIDRLYLVGTVSAKQDAVFEWFHGHDLCLS